MITADGLKFRPIIGLEIHVQLRTQTKLYCSCPVQFGAAPNSLVCPTCMGLPGALPVLNRLAIDLAVRAGLALNCTIAEETHWDRKNYYYPDLPKNYQISQYDQPLACNGYFELPFKGRIRRIRISRAHLEEDAGKNLHDPAGHTGVDLNRAGTPLLEIVTAPDLHNADEAREFAVQIQRLLRYLGLSHANMQRGELRFEPNINLAIMQNGQEVRTPIVEVKNLNSFRALHGAISYEVQRQVEQWSATGETAAMGNKYNRGWDDIRGVTIPQREKEEAHDYRFLPEPDLVPLLTDRAWVAGLKQDLPELPICRCERLVSEYKVTPRSAPALVDDRATADLLDDAAAAGGHKPTLARHFLGIWTHLAHERGITIARLGISPGRLAELANLVHKGRINATAAARLAAALLDNYESPTALATRLNLLQTQDQTQIDTWVDQVLADNAQAVQDAIRKPKKLEAARGFLAGQVMKISCGQADPGLVRSTIEQRLDQAEHAEE
ncbi:MAG: Asp-tRNA(Asn)/Glu-tRNA(Gln) amidotransferase subunit GatB [Planctomycetota bacterium]